MVAFLVVLVVVTLGVNTYLGVNAALRRRVRRRRDELNRWAGAHGWVHEPAPFALSGLPWTEPADPLGDHFTAHRFQTVLRGHEMHAVEEHTGGDHPWVTTTVRVANLPATLPRISLNDPASPMPEVEVLEQWLGRRYAVRAGDAEAACHMLMPMRVWLLETTPPPFSITFSGRSVTADWVGGVEAHGGIGVAADFLVDLVEHLPAELLEPPTPVRLPRMRPATVRSRPAVRA